MSSPNVAYPPCLCNCCDECREEIHFLYSENANQKKMIEVLRRQRNDALLQNRKKASIIEAQKGQIVFFRRETAKQKDRITELEFLSGERPTPSELKELDFLFG